MTSPFKLIAKTLTLQVPPRSLLYAVRIRLHRLFRTGNRRFEFEKLYLENPDPWHYRSSPYELEKYERTIATALQARSHDDNALEIGCSIGVFTKMLAPHFRKLISIDVSKEAIRIASRFNQESSNVRFVHGDLRSLDLGGGFDVIFCAEVLNYIPERDAKSVCQTLDKQLDPEGVVITVTPHRKSEQTFFNFDGWDQAFTPLFREVSKEVVADEKRPYEITVYCRRDSPRPPSA